MTPRRRVGVLLAVGGLLAAGVVAVPSSHGREEPRPGGGATKAAGRVRPELGDEVGRVTKVDRGRGEVRIDFGRARGAEVGMRLWVHRTNPDAGDLGEGERWLGRLEVTTVDARESTTRPVVDGGAPDAEARRPEDEIRPGDGVRYATDNEAFDISKLATGDEPDAVDRLARARVEVARRRLEEDRTFYENGTITIERYIDASRAMMEAVREAAGTRDGEVAAPRAHLERLTRLVQREAERFENEAGSLANLTVARSAQAEAALMLARARRKAAGDRGPAAPRGGGGGAAPRAGDRSRPLAGEKVGRITRFDARRGEARVDFDRAGVAAVGMRLKVIPRHDDLHWRLEVTGVEGRGGTAKVIEPERPPAGHTLFPGDEVFCVADNTAFRLFQLATGDHPGAVAELARARRELARRRFDHLRAGFENGTIAMDGYADASRTLMEAERDAAANRAEETAALRAHLERVTRTIDDEVSKLYAPPCLGIPVLNVARDKQAEAALMLARARRKDGGR